MSWFRRKSSQAEAGQVAPDSADTRIEAERPQAAKATPGAAGAAPRSNTSPAEGQAEEGEGAASKRRRGSRGGRGRKKPTATAGGDASEAQAEEAAPRDGRKPATSGREPAKRRSGGSGSGERSSERSGERSSDRRRKQAPRRAPLPTAKRELLISVDVGEQRVAILEDDRVAEVFLERPERRSISGNIYLGVVDNVLPGMEAAFVEIGLEKNGFLYVDEIVVPELEGKRHGKKIQELISRGEKILVQAVKDPMKTKGARLTTEISLPGRFLVFVPNGEGLGVSRRLEDAERNRLKEILKRIAPAEGGVIVRTAAEGASAEDVERDLVFLQRLWKTIQTQGAAATAPELVYREAELPLRIVRDLFAGDFEAAWVDNDRALKRIVGYLKKTSPHMAERVHRWKEKDRLFDRFGVEKEIASTLDRRVDLPSGGYLIFDYAEAFTVVDVNTGRFVGSRSKTSTGRLEDTIVANNLEAVKEVVRQLRLRDIGGIIVIDFIDMANVKNRQAVEEALRIELERDRTKTYVVEISPLGLVEMTRQNVTEGPREVMTRKCPTCGGDGIVVSDSTAALKVERELRAVAAAGAGSRIQAYRVAVHPRVLWLLAGAGGERLAALEEATRRRFFLVAAEGHTHPDACKVLAEGKLADLQPTSPIVEGGTLDVKPAELGEHDASTAVAKVDGVVVVIAGAANLVGKKATVRVGRVLDGVAFATLADMAEPPTPITFEAEAEKPTRAPAKRKQESELTEAATNNQEEAGEADAAGEDEGEADAAGEDEGDVDAEGGPKPRKRRRGSRGGKRHRKPAAASEAQEGVAHEGEADGADEDSGSEAPAETVTDSQGTEAPKRPARRRQPRIHVPAGEGAATAEPKADVAEPTADAEASAAEGKAAAEGEAPAEGDAPKKKRSRRGSRGGRNRRKPAGAAAAGGEALADDDQTTADDETTAADPDGDESEAAVAEPVVESGETESGAYVPMSEWLDDFDRRG